jgi:hypothetical protein
MEVKEEHHTPPALSFLWEQLGSSRTAEQKNLNSNLNTANQ